jgi:GTP cyclohydrolase I
MAQDDRHTLVRHLLEAIGEDPEREGLLDTPARVVRSWAKLYGGYAQDPKEILKTAFEETENYNQMVVLSDIELYSTCEHHMLPFVGKAHVGYIPGKKVVGISKLARLVECFARRLQIQEKLTQQIAHALQDTMEPRGVGVMIIAQHFCMTSRGVEKQNSLMKTSSLLGVFQEEKVREEFHRLCRMK